MSSDKGAGIIHNMGREKSRCMAFKVEEENIEVLQGRPKNIQNIIGPLPTGGA